MNPLPCLLIPLALSMATQAVALNAAIATPPAIAIRIPHPASLGNTPCHSGPPKSPSWKKTGLYPFSVTQRIAASSLWAWSGM